MRQETTTRRDKSPVEAAVPAAILRRAQTARLPVQRARFSRTDGFTLAELIVSVGVLVLLVFLASQLINSAATVATLGQKKMDVDAQARQLLDRMAIDFAQMVKRSDADYYVKSSAPFPQRNVLQAGNDRIAFYSSVPGYYPTSSYESPVSIVAYRVNSSSTSPSYTKMERMGKGLLWNAATPTPAPVVFIPVPLAAPLPIGDLPVPPPNPLPPPAWPEASSATTSWSDSEVIGPQVFRFEYYYLLKNGNFSGVPWISPHSSLAGMQDVSAIVVNIAVIDPKSKVLLGSTEAQINAQIAKFSAPADSRHFLVDYSSSMIPGQLRTQWQNKLNGIINPTSADYDPTMPASAISSIRLYERFFYLSAPVL